MRRPYGEIKTVFSLVLPGMGSQLVIDFIMSSVAVQVAVYVGDKTCSGLLFCLRTCHNSPSFLLFIVLSVQVGIFRLDRFFGQQEDLPVGGVQCDCEPSVFHRE